MRWMRPYFLIAAALSVALAYGQQTAPPSDTPGMSDEQVAGAAIQMALDASLKLPLARPAPSPFFSGAIRGIGLPFGTPPKVLMPLAGPSCAMIRLLDANPAIDRGIQRNSAAPAVDAKMVKPALPPCPQAATRPGH